MFSIRYLPFIIACCIAPVAAVSGYSGLPPMRFIHQFRSENSEMRWTQLKVGRSDPGDICKKVSNEVCFGTDEIQWQDPPLTDARNAPRKIVFGPATGYAKPFERVIGGFFPEWLPK